MSPLFAKSNPEKRSVFISKMRRIFYWFFALIIVITGAIIYLRFFYTYSEGYRAGLLQKFSKKGFIFKTYEGEMILSSISSTNNVAIASEKFNFSVINKAIVPKLDTIQGEIVIVHYIQKKGSAFWRGDSPYLVDSVRVKR